jgi:hypothetical protein
MTPTELIESSNAILARLRTISPDNPWTPPTGNGVAERVRSCLDELAYAAAHLGAREPPPTLPSLGELFAGGMTTRRGLAIAIRHVTNLLCWCESLLPAGKPQDEPPAMPRHRESAPHTHNNRPKSVNARMLEKMLQDTENGSKECFGWTCSQWARFLGCSQASVVATRTWRRLREEREEAKAKRAMDRRRRPKGSEQRHAAQWD